MPRTIEGSVLAIADKADTMAGMFALGLVPSGSKDDRLMALAFAVHCWEEKVRRNLINMNRTREAEAARTRLTLTDQVYLFQQNQLGQFFKAKRMDRLNAQRLAQRAGWRYR